MLQKKRVAPYLWKSLINFSENPVLTVGGSRMGLQLKISAVQQGITFASTQLL